MLFILVIIAAILPALVLVYFIYRKDKYEKEPVSQLLKGFGFGAQDVTVSDRMEVRVNSLDMDGRLLSFQMEAY